MQNNDIDALKKGAAVLYQTLQNVALLHDATEIENDSGEMIEGCEHCSAIAEAIVHYPCPTMRLVLNDFEVEEEKTPAE